MHPSLRIIALIALAIAIQFAQPRVLFAIGLLAILAALVLYPALLWRMQFRSRWLLLILVLIFSFTTPGEYVRGWTSAIAPTYEGIGMGLLQAGRLITMLAALALLLGSTGREPLMSGIYILMKPLGLLGLSPARFTARLWLTLHYVEEAPEKHHRSKLAMLNEIALYDQLEMQQQRLVLTMPAWNVVDLLVLVVAGTLLIWWLA